jgi:pyruvate formate lyase activating enzyme
MKEALYFERATGSTVRCLLCPHFCTITEGHSGICKVRVNKAGKLYTESYGQLAAIYTDPVEKKPLYHFYPGRQVLSIGGVGCNFRCACCQNSSISQVFPENFHRFHPTQVYDLVRLASETENNLGIAYTYNEPFTFYEFMFDCAKEAKAAGLKNIVVSNGYVNPGPLSEILPFIDAFNIDLKGFREEFYKTFAGGSLAPVLETIQMISQAKKHLELTFLVVPGENDNEHEFTEMVEWIARNLGEYIPLHISRYFPAYKTFAPPTPVATLEKFYGIATSFLKHVFLGNISDEKRSSTRCPECGKDLIRRNHYTIQILALDNNGRCGSCGSETKILC